MIRAILMDFNGVVIDDEAIQMQAYAEVFKDEGIDLTEEMYYSCLGMNDGKFVRSIAGMAGTEVAEEKIPDIVDRKTARWREIMDQGIPLFDGVEDFVKRMSRSFELGLVSMARRDEILHILDITGLADYFPVVVTAEEVSTTKPDPECYRLGFKQIDAVHAAKYGFPLTRRKCVVIEDAPQGITAAKGARLRTLGVTSTVADSALREAGAEAVTHRLSDWNAESFERVFE
jgi:beta-phosphoglucomutase